MYTYIFFIFSPNDPFIFCIYYGRKDSVNLTQVELRVW